MSKQKTYDSPEAIKAAFRQIVKNNCQKDVELRLSSYMKSFDLVEIFEKIDELSDHWTSGVVSLYIPHDFNRARFHHKSSWKVFYKDYNTTFFQNESRFDFQGDRYMVIDLDTRQRAVWIDKEVVELVKIVSSLKERISHENSKEYYAFRDSTFKIIAEIMK